MVATDEMKVDRLLHCLYPQLSLSCQYAYGKYFYEACDIVLRAERKANEIQADQRRRYQ